MSRVLPAGLLSIAAILAAVIASEVVIGGAGGEPAVVGSAAQVVAATAGGPSADQAQSWAQTVLSRPLFSPSRRPPHDAAVAAGPLRLTGVVVGPGGGRAIFMPAAGGKPVVVEVGGRIGHETVRGIMPDAVTLSGPGGEHVLRPTFASTTDGGPAAMSTRGQGPQ